MLRDTASHDGAHSLNVAFWNLGRRALSECLVALIREFSIDVLVLAEYGDYDAVSGALSAHGLRLAPGISNCHKVVVLHGSSYEVTVPRYEGLRYSTRSIMISGDLDVTLACAHLPSKRDSAPSTRLDAAQRFGRAVRQLQKQVGHHRTILLGDLNMNPFEDGVSAASGLHGVMTKEIAQRRARTVGGEESSILYNPMWNRFTDRTPGPAGTYFRAGSDDVEYFWNTYDQVLIGADLLDCFDDDSLVVVTKLGNMRLAGANGRPDASKASDHFPITFSIDI